MRLGAWEIAANEMGKIVLTGCIGAIVGGAVVYAVLTIKPSSHSMEFAPLTESLTRLNEATAQGVSLSAFSDLLLDAKTKFQVVQKDLPEDAKAMVSLAVQHEDDVRQIWSNSIEFSRICPNSCEDTLEPPMLDLGILKKKADYKAHFKDVIDNFGFDTTAQSTLVSEALTAAGPSLSSAIAKVQSL
ncbi:MAG: hypothetical protein KGJ49_00050 [Alphaproteobacteria bacterium]|nr:hypothetical protein [Alphaproteobacteria bacterium]